MDLISIVGNSEYVFEIQSFYWSVCTSPRSLVSLFVCIFFPYWDSLVLHLSNSFWGTSYWRKRPKTCDERNNFFPFKKVIWDHKLQFFQCPISQWLRPDDLLPKTKEQLLKIKHTLFAFDSRVVGNGILERLYLNPGEIQNSNWHRICLGSRPWIVWKIHKLYHVCDYMYLQHLVGKEFALFTLCQIS